jgi:peptidoglycan LD-endopeptidase LytH
MRVRTIFTPFALCASLGLLVALGAAEKPRAHAPKAIGDVKVVERAPTIIVPVRGLSAADLSNTWGAARSEGRRHEGIDIMAPQGAPVLAAADGEIVRLWNSELGGTGIYQADANGRLVYYYAHLSARAENLDEGDRVLQGDVIGYVGATGNATTPHLHFEIHRTSGASRWWGGRAVNPYGYLASGLAPE